MTIEDLKTIKEKRDEVLSKCKSVVEVCDKNNNIIALCDNEETAKKFISWYNVEGVKVYETRVILDDDWCKTHNL